MSSSATHQYERPSDDDEEMMTESEKRNSCIKKSIVAIILLVLIGFVIADSLMNQYIVTGIEMFLDWIRENPGPGVVVFMLVYFVATIFFVPGSVLTLGAGLAFGEAFGLGVGVLLGVISVFFGASAGAIVSFLLGRFLLRDWVTGLTKKYAIFEALDAAFEEKGFRIMILLRLSPIVPFNAINYIAGVTAISFWAYFWALIGILPGTTLYVFLGASTGSLVGEGFEGEGNFVVTIIVTVVGIVFGFAALAVTSYYAKQELRKIAEKNESRDATGGGDDFEAVDSEREKLTLSDRL